MEVTVTHLKAPWPEGTKIGDTVKLPGKTLPNWAVGKCKAGAAEAAAKPGKDTTDKFFAVNEQFHMRLLEIANNRWRDQMVADLRKVMKLNRHNSLLKTGRIEESLAEHQAIMAALLARDAQRTQERMREHFANGLEAAE